MSGFNLKRKLKRTRQQELRVVESQNRSEIFQLRMQQQGIIEALVGAQKTLVAMQNILKRRGAIDDLAMQQEFTAIEEMERMKRQALVIDPSKSKLTEEKKNG